MIKLLKNIKPEFVDERGEIKKLLDDGSTNIKSVLLITGKSGAVRGNHYHKQDTHYVYMLSGKMEYSEKIMDGEDTRVETVLMEPGDMVVSQSRVIHATKFIEDGAFLALATRSRHQEAYEEDTVRIKIV